MEKTARGRSSHELLHGSTGAAGRLVTSLINLFGGDGGFWDGGQVLPFWHIPQNRTGLAISRRHARTNAARAPKNKLPQN